MSHELNPFDTDDFPDPSDLHAVIDFRFRLATTSAIENASHEYLRVADDFEVAVIGTYRNLPFFLRRPLLDAVLPDERIKYTATEFRRKWRDRDPMPETARGRELAVLKDDTTNFYDYGGSFVGDKLDTNQTQLLVRTIILGTISYFPEAKDKPQE